MTNRLHGKRVAILAADMFERVELEEPRQALEDAGATTEIVSLHGGEIQGFDHFEPSVKIKVDRTVEEVSADDYDALLIPGGVGNPDQLRGDENAVELVRAFGESGKPLAVICHGPWMLVEAGLAARPQADVVADAADGHRERGRHLGRRGGRRRRRHRHQPQARRHPRVLGEDDRGDRRGPARPAPPAGGGRQPRLVAAFAAARWAGYPVPPRGGGSSVGRAPGCGPGGRGFESRSPPLAETAADAAVSR